MSLVHEVKSGRSSRMSFAKITEPIGIPDLIEIQKDSYNRLLETGLREVLDDVSPITDYSEILTLEFLDYEIRRDKIKYDIEECKERDVNYSAPLYVKVHLYNKETGEHSEDDVFMGDFPLMTPKGTFVINGAERVVVSQLVRSPGAYYTSTIDKTGKSLFSSQVIPNRGAWLEFDTDSADIMSVRIDRTRKLPATVLLRALGLGKSEDILYFFGPDIVLEETIKKDELNSEEDGLLAVSPD